MKSKLFISVDWGTSNFRLRLVNTASLAILEEITSSTGGTKHLFDLWEKQGGEREAVFLNFLDDHIRQLKAGIPSGTMVVISGMASSAIGMRNLPYADIPFNINGSGIATAYIKANENFKHDILLISGIKSEEDVMRGEETQLIGCISDESKDLSSQLFIFPGTHSKHIIVNNGRVDSFKTYMTGEIFNILIQESILRSSIEKNKDIYSKEALEAFKQGVNTAARSNLLHSLFLTRTNSLFGKLSNKDNFNFLSGLLIGTELKELIGCSYSRINLAGGSGLSVYYQLALETLGLTEKTSLLSPEWVDEAVIRGQNKIMNQYQPEPKTIVSESN